MRIRYWLSVAVLLAGCSTPTIEAAQPDAGQAYAAIQVVTPSPDPVDVLIPAATLPSDAYSPSGGNAPADEPTPELGSESDPFAGLRIDDLTARSYGGPGIGIGEVVKTGRGFTQHKMVYYSDSLRITGLADIPDGEGPFPVIIVNHGYLRPVDYRSGFDSWRLADWFAERGYIALMPDYRNYAGSERGPNPFHIGYAIDVMNLAAQIHSLDQASPGQIGMIGHSMGGEIAMWPMVISDEVDAIVLYASMTGDVGRNWAHARRYWPAQRAAMDATAIVYGRPEDNPQAYAEISPATYFDRARMPVMIHHGNRDETLPYWWAEEMWHQMETARVEVTFYPYPNGGHTFGGRIFETMMQRSLDFFEQTVRQNVNSPDTHSE